MNATEEKLQRRIHAIADPARRQILHILKERGACSLEDKLEGLCGFDIEKRIGLSQPTVSHHMAILTKAGLVKAERIGHWMWYRRNDSSLREFARSLKRNL